MNPLRHNLLSLLLTAAAVHQVGACPCGDLDHHGWYGVWRAVAGGESSGHDHGPADHAPEHDDDAPRHGSHDPATLTQAMALTLGLFASDLAAAAPTLLSEVEASASPSRLDPPSAAPPALLLRARLQVFRL